MRDIEKRGQFLDVVGRSLSLPVEEGCHSNFVTANLLCNGLERQLFLCFCLEESGGRRREARDQRCLYSFASDLKKKDKEFYLHQGWQVV